MFARIYDWFHELMHRPPQVFWICVAVAIVGVVLDGTAFRLWSLNRDHDLLTSRIEAARERSQQLAFRIQKSQELDFIERAARDQFDLVKEGDLVFIFSDEGGENLEKTSGNTN